MASNRHEIVEDASRFATTICRRLSKPPEVLHPGILELPENPYGGDSEAREAESRGLSIRQHVSPRQNCSSSDRISAEPGIVASYITPLAAAVILEVARTQQIGLFAGTLGSSRKYLTNMIRHSWVNKPSAPAFPVIRKAVPSLSSPTTHLIDAEESRRETIVDPDAVCHPVIELEPQPRRHG